MRSAALLLLAAACGWAQEPFSLDLDLRYRFVTGDSGGQTYRSVVNLSDGPRLFGAEMHYEGKDRVDLSLHNIGDPDSDLRLDISRPKLYEFSLQYRTLAYFNNLFSYANPLLEQGVLSSQRAIDYSQQQVNLDLRYTAHSRITPFLSFLRASGDGNGITPLVGVGDEFPVPTTFGDTLTTVRGGVELRGQRWSAVVEEGHTAFNGDQDLNSGANPGNRTDSIVLNQLSERYRASGGGWFSRGVFQAEPIRQLAFSGHFIYSQPENNVTHELNATGAFVNASTLVPYTNLMEQSLAEASKPRTSGSWSTEFRPHANWRIRNTWFSDAFQVSGATQITGLTTPPPAELSVLNLRYDQVETEISTDIGKFLTLRAGHRYVRSDVDLPPPELVYAGSPTGARIRRNIALAGGTLTLWKGRARVHADYEISPGGETYFRTGLLDYHKFSVQGRLRLTDAVQVTIAEKTLSNSNVGINFTNRQTAVSVEWTPEKSRRLVLVGAYSHETLRSAASFIDPATFQSMPSNYDEIGNNANAFAELRFKRGVLLRAGGGISDTGGTLATRYYTPQGEIVVPASKRVKIVAEWRWYDFGSIEAFRTHTVSVGTQIRLGAPPSAR